MTSAAVYVRISKDSQLTGLGVDRQLFECKERLASLGVSDFEVFEDNDLSASKYSRKPRPAYDRLMGAVSAGRITTVAVWDLDRLLRQMRQLEDWIDLAETSGIRLLTVREEIDLSTPGGRANARFRITFAAQESEQKSERIKAKNRQRTREGLPVLGKRKFGWANDGVTPVPAEAEAVVWGTQAVLRGESLNTVRREWNARGLLSTVGNTWDTSSQVKAVLLRERNVGRLVVRGEVQPESRITPLVTVEDFEGCRAILETRRSTAGRKPSASWLSGVMTCPCGSVLYAKHEHYVCSRRGLGAAETTVKHVAILKTEAEQHLKVNLYAEANRRARWDRPQAADVEHLKRLEADLAAARKAHAQASEMMFEPDIDKAVVRRRLSAAAQRIEELEAERQEARTANSEAARIAALMDVDPGGFDFTAAWIEHFDALDTEAKRDLARGTFSVKVHPGRGVERLELTAL